MRGVVVVVCLVVAGCDVVWRLDEVHGGLADADRPDDTLDSDTVDPCPFRPRVQISAGNGNNDPQLSEDGLELFFVRGSAGTYDLWHAVRTNTQSPFPMGSAISEINSPAEDTDPAISADGNTIVFKSLRGGSTTNRAFQATRTARGQTFSTPVMLGNLPNPVAGLDLSADGLTLYVDDGGKLSAYSRPTAAVTMFVLGMMLTIERTQFPSLSADGLELFYNGAGVVRRRRASTMDQFEGTAQVIDDGAGDPDITFDGTRLVTASNGFIYISERCVP